MGQNRGQNRHARRVSPSWLHATTLTGAPFPRLEPPGWDVPCQDGRGLNLAGRERTILLSQLGVARQAISSILLMAQDFSLT